MKKDFRIFITLVAVMTMFFFFIQCGGNKEKTDAKKSNSEQQADSQKVKKPKPILSKKLLALNLSPEQKIKCETLYKEIFPPDILAQRNETFKKLKGLKKDSEEFIKLKKEIGDKLRPYNTKFNDKLKEILTPEQQTQYFAN